MRMRQNYIYELWIESIFRHKLYLLGKIQFIIFNHIFHYHGLCSRVVSVSIKDWRGNNPNQNRLCKAMHKFRSLKRIPKLIDDINVFPDLNWINSYFLYNVSPYIRHFLHMRKSIIDRKWVIVRQIYPCSAAVTELGLLESLQIWWKGFVCEIKWIIFNMNDFFRKHMKETAAMFFLVEYHNRSMQ